MASPLPSISVITPTIPERSELLDDCKASVAAQTVPVVEHLVGADADGAGPSVVRNGLAERAEGDWILPLDDDDTLDPDYVETVAPHLTDAADVVYSWHHTDYSLCPPGTIEDLTYNRLFNDAVLVHEGNFIPVTACIRKSVWDEVGGMPEPPERLQPGEDWEFFKLCLGAGAVFKLVPEVCWSYRVQPGSRNRHLSAA